MKDPDCFIGLVFKFLQKLGLVDVDFFDDGSREC